MKKIFDILLCALVCVSAYGQKTTNLKTKQWNDPYLSVGSRTASGYTPSAALLSQYCSFSSAAASFDLREETGGAFCPEEGDGLRCGRFDASSFLRLKGNSAVTGKVGYQRAVRHNVILNETADYELLRPYVLIDTVGGNLQHEQYSFQGAWMRRSDRLIYSVNGGYKAVHEYRSFDPRPRNISSDFKAGVSFGCVFDHGSVIAYAGYRKYHQSQDVSFMNNTGANTALFHSTGLGSDYYRFRSTGVFAATRYAGQGFEAGVVGTGASGKLECGLAYEFLGVTRHLSNQNEAPLSDLGIGILKAFVSYHFSPKFAMEAKGEYDRRRGRENVIDCAASGMYNDILSLDMYSQHKTDVSLSGVLRVERDYGTWHLMPSMRWMQSLEKYRYPLSWMNFSLLSGQLYGGFSSIKGLWLYDLAAGIGYGDNMDGSYSFQSGEERIREAYKDKFTRWTSDYVKCHVNVLVQKEIKNIMAVFSRISFEEMFYGPNRGISKLTISIGISY